MKRLITVGLLVFVLAMNLFVILKTQAPPTMPIKNVAYDFGAFFYAANIVLDPAVPITTLYDLDAFYELPPRYGTELIPMPFIYSLASAYVLSPLGLLSYSNAELALQLINLLAYVGGIFIIFNILQIKDNIRVFVLALLLVYMPYIDDRSWDNVNALLFFIVSLALYATTKDRPGLCGSLLSAAALFKLFPVAIALVLGLKNWRVMAGFALVFGAAMLIPGSLGWFKAMTVVTPIYTAVYKALGMPWFAVYAILIVGATALISYRARGHDYPTLASFAIVGVFLVMPVVEYHHLTLLAIPMLLLLVADRWQFAALVAILVSIAYLPGFAFMSFVGLLLLWVDLAGCLLGLRLLRVNSQ